MVHGKAHTHQPEDQAGGVNLAEPCSAWKPVQAIAFENAGYAGSGDLDVMVTGEVTDDAHGTQVVGLA